MKIRKINDDKVQIIITNQDLEERDFKKWELMPISPKAQELFQDILDMAYEECGFEIEEDSQLMVEAYPLSIDSFVVVMTKVRASYGNDHISFFLPNQQGCEEDEESPERGTSQVWVFSDLEACSQACSRIEPDYIEASSLYKLEGQYYLTLSILPKTQPSVTAILGEYSEWVPYDEAFLKEYGLLLIARDAVANMASIVR
ncbi:MAG: adaptor protein MecA [Peptococcaceae bacterium]|nr:adaptor protein MecA [Peptococcaceae bacterium]MDH7524267.1 adaptor protein MecA [Peptococcaceae bacterium]